MKLPGILLLLPFLLVRFGLAALLGKGTSRRAAHFPPLAGKEKAAYWVYELSYTAMVVRLCFLPVSGESSWLLGAGAFFSGGGLLLCALSLRDFAMPTPEGLNCSGLYRFSRNPMYVSYFFYFAGCALLTRSWSLFALLAVFQAASHPLILAEERWCREKFGAAYDQYQKRVRRYL